MAARSYAAAMAVNLDSHPYPKPRDIVGSVTICELCNGRKILTKDWAAHKNSKAHRKIETDKRDAEEAAQKAANATGWGDDSSNSPDTENTWGSPTFDVPDDTAGFSTQGGRKSGGFNGACYGCGETGHSKRDCPKASGGRGCFNCGESGHNKADCPNPRQGGGGGGGGGQCYGCGQVGHNKANCPNPRQGGGGGGDRVCFNCNQAGHSKSDCTNERVLTCRNCDAVGHIGKDCPEPKDWSRVKCNNCGNMGHTVVRCKEPPKEEEADSGWGNTTAQPSAGDWAQPAGDWANTDDGGGGGEANEWGDASAVAAW